MHAALLRAWQRRGALAVALLPLAALYGALGALQRVLYRTGVLRAQHVPVPVVVVGNVVAGGAGKTPVVLQLLAHLQARGHRPGVLSRGYGRAARDVRLVRPGSTADEVGDEPLLVASHAGVPVAVGERRIDAARALLHAHPDTTVLVCDDGLQHLALARDVEIVVFDDRGTANGWLLPAGPLREPWPRRADLVLRPPGQSQAIRGHDVTRRLAPQLVRADGTRQPLATLAGERFTAVAGIARPEAFFAMLRAAGAEPAATVPLPDHHAYGQLPPGIPAGGTLVCTEKDAVKLWRLRPDAWAAPLQVEIAPAFWDALDARLR